MPKASRHKSCVACIQTKRKCDRTWPRCQRCIARGSACHYIGRSDEQPSRSHDPDFDQLISIQGSSDEQALCSWALQQCPTDPASLVDLLPDSTTFEFPNHPFNLGSMPNDNDLFIHGTQDITIHQAPSNDEQDIMQTTTPNAMIRTRADFVAKRLSSIPRTFAEQGQTMFIHRMQFQQNCHPALQDAMSACALYCMTNVANQALVFQNLDHKCHQLIASTNVELSSKTDLLAALQALLLYQMMRLFNGDIRLRAHAEADGPIVALWASQLATYMCNSDHSRIIESDSTTISMATMEPESDWQSWLVDESIRRTVITSFLLNGLYNFLKLGSHNPVDLRIYFTAQTALWSAQSGFSWRRARLERESLEIRVTNWHEAMAKAEPRDLEELGLLTMVLFWGLEGTQAWLGDEFTVKHGLQAI
ncbi:hypothetical protein BU24DRAFT_424953 [Aaosphaeria arxii CBS 175.79]|uniref:Zn(2)-C6 fungal-type domain-containing protein n=1 Tax=Aaosphaeria arxii CBS 175.79 TaxID=1450172 RepID=A0A6A5XKY3_9PLEO|nr:uncharacterized protein BU24DRAFT_424953 [Aaosphaeria arxii CBS 175.79]KAF2013935.1 hypothetical protein BU24DRAFT_424953 [Aaosphaeria arxii CBS 175.79]